MTRSAVRACLTILLLTSSPAWAAPNAVSGPSSDPVLGPGATPERPVAPHLNPAPVGTPLPHTLTDPHARIALDQIFQRRCVEVAVPGLLVGLAGYGALELTAHGQDRGNLLLLAGEGSAVLMGSVFAFGGLMGWLVSGADMHALKTGRPWGQSSLRLAPLLLAHGRAPGLGVTARF